MHKLVLYNSSLPETTFINDITVAIGEQLTYRVTFTFAEGDHNASKLVFTVPTSRVRQHIQNATVIFVGSTMRSDFPLAVPSVVTDPNNDTSSEKVVFDFPAFWNIPDNYASADDTIVVEIITVVVDATVNRDDLGDYSVTTFTYNNTAYTNNVFTLLLVPNIVITKTHASLGYTESGTVVMYTVTVYYSGDLAAAFDVNVQDILSPHLALITGSVTTNYGTVRLGNNNGSTVVYVYHSPMMFSPSVQQIQIKYSATVLNTAPVGELVYNTAYLSYQTAPNATYNEKNIRYLYDDAQRSFRLDYCSLSITLDTNSLSQPFDQYMAVGQTARITASITFPQGTAYNSIVTIALPKDTTKLYVVSSSIIYMANNFNSTKALKLGSLGNITDLNGDGFNDTIVYDFGDLLNVPEGVSRGATDAIIFELYALLPNIPGNTHRSSLRSVLTLNYGSVSTLTQEQTLTMYIAEPILRVTKKVVDPITKLNMPASTYWEAGRNVTYEVTIEHDGDSLTTAYNILVKDTLNQYVKLYPETLTTSSGAILTGNNTGDNSILIAPANSVRYNVITIYYTVQLLNHTGVASSVRNYVNVTYYSIDIGAHPVARQAYVQNSVSVPIAAVVHSSPFIVNSTVPTSLFNNVAIGEVVTLRFTFVVPQGTLLNATLNLTTPGSGKMSFVQPATVVRMASNFESSEGITLGSTSTLSDRDQDGILDTAIIFFGTLVNLPDGISKGENDNITVDYNVLVHLPNDNRGALQPRGELTFVSDSGRQVNSAFVTLDVIIPTLNITKKTVYPDYIDTGTVMNYTVTVNHLAPIFSGAYNVVVTDPLPPQLALMPGSVVVTRAQSSNQTFIGGVVLVGNSAEDLFVSVYVDPIDIDAVVTISYSTKVKSNAEPYSNISNTAYVTWYSAFEDGVHNHGNIWKNTKNSTVITPVSRIAMTFHMTSNIPETHETEISIGEIFKWFITLAIPQGTTNNASLTISTASFPSALQVLSSKVYYMASTMISSEGVVQDTTSIPEDLNGDLLQETVHYNFGKISNIDDGLHQDVNDSIVVEVEVLVTEKDMAAEDVLESSAQFLYFNGFSQSIHRTQYNKIVEPSFVFTKSSNLTSGFIEAGDFVEYILTIDHAAVSGPAFEVTVQDSLSENHVLQPASVTTNQGYFVVGNNSGDSVIRVFLPNAFVPGTRLIIKYTALLTQLVEASEDVFNYANVTFTSATTNVQNVGNTRNYTSHTDNFITIGSPFASIELVDSDMQESSMFDVSVGEQVIIKASFTLPQGIFILVLLC